MKSKFFILTSFCLILVLAACSALQPVGQADNQPASNPNPQEQLQKTNGQPPDSLQARLAIGLLKLEGSPQALTADQASQLLPHWQTIKTLYAANPPSKTALDNEYQQVEKILTADQTQAIKNLPLTFNNILDLMKSLGIQVTPAARRPMMNGSPGTPATSGTRPPTLDPAQRQTRIAQRTLTPGSANLDGGPNGVRFGFDRLFIDSLIQLLQKRASGG